MGLIEELGTFLHEQSYLSLDGTNGTSVSTPDSPALSITGDIDIRVKVAADDWTPGLVEILVAKAASGASGWRWQLMTGGQLRLTHGGVFDATSTVATGFTDGTAHWVRYTRNVTTGDVTFFTSDDGVTFTQLGGVVATAASATPDDDSDTSIGVFAGATSEFSGKVFAAEIRDGIDGTIVADPDFSDGTVWTTSTTSADDDSGNTWTLNGNATIEGRDNFGLGSNLFLNALPDEPNNANSIIETGGVAPNHVFARTLPAWENSRVAVTSRSTSSTEARDDANIAWFALQEISNSTLSGVSWLRVSAVQSPFLLERDERNRAVFQANYDCVRRTTST